MTYTQIIVRLLSYSWIESYELGMFLRGKTIKQEMCTWFDPH
jgi:hypothetical protein